MLLANNSFFINLCKIRFYGIIKANPILLFFEHSVKYSLNQKFESRNKLLPYFTIFLSQYSLTLSYTHSLPYTRTQTIGLSLIYFVFKYSFTTAHAHVYRIISNSAAIKYFLLLSSVSYRS